MKLQERHTSCTLFKIDPSPNTVLGVHLSEAIFSKLFDWIVAEDLHHKAAVDTAESRMALTQFRDVVGRFVQLSHSAMNSRGLFNITRWPSCFIKDDNKRNSLVFLLLTLLQSEAVSRINMPHPNTGIRPLHYFYKQLGKSSRTLLLSYGAHLDVASRDHPILIPGSDLLETMVINVSCYNPFIQLVLQEAALVPDVPVDNQLSSPLPLLCQCSWAILREEIPYHQLYLPPRIKDCIALHEVVHERV